MGRSETNTEVCAIVSESPQTDQGRNARPELRSEPDEQYEHSGRFCVTQTIEILRSFDRKERFAVLREALGFDAETEVEANAPRLGDGFRERLGNCIGVAIPERAWLAMDFHLDWIEMSVYLAARGVIPDKTPFRNEHFPKINQNQKDVDLLVAFEGDDTGETRTHMVLIEAKAYLGWNNTQLNGKAEKLREIFGDEGTCWRAVTPHFVLMTAKRSKQISTQSWPKWMTKRDQPVWLDYKLPRRRKITRCTANGNPSKNGRHLRLDSER